MLATCTFDGSTEFEGAGLKDASLSLFKVVGDAVGFGETAAERDDHIDREHGDECGLAALFWTGKNLLRISEATFRVRAKAFCTNSRSAKVSTKGCLVSG